MGSQPRLWELVSSPQCLPPSCIPCVPHCSSHPSSFFFLSPSDLIHTAGDPTRHFGSSLRKEISWEHPKYGVKRNQKQDREEYLQLPLLAETAKRISLRTQAGRTGVEKSASREEQQTLSGEHTKFTNGSRRRLGSNRQVSPGGGLPLRGASWGYRRRRWWQLRPEWKNPPAKWHPVPHHARDVPSLTSPAVAALPRRDLTDKSEFETPVFSADNITRNVPSSSPPFPPLLPWWVNPRRSFPAPCARCLQYLAPDCEPP